MGNSLDYHSCPSRLAHKYILSYFNKPSRALSLSLNNACWIFSQAFKLHHVWENFSNFWSSHYYKMHWFEALLLMPLSTSPSSCHHVLRKLFIPPGSILSKICFPQQQKEVEETMLWFMKVQSENVKMTWNIRFLCFVWFRIFSNVIALQFCK